MPVIFCFFAFVFFGGSNRKVGSIPIIIGNPPTGLHLVCKITTHASKRKFFVDAYGMNMYLWYMEKGLKKLARGPLHSLKTLTSFYYVSEIIENLERNFQIQCSSSIHGPNPLPSHWKAEQKAHLDPSLLHGLHCEKVEIWKSSAHFRISHKDGSLSILYCL